MQSELKPRIVLFSAFYEPYMSGAEQMVKQIAENLGDKYDITLITGRYSRNNSAFQKRDTFNLIRVGVGHKQLDKLLFIFLAPFYARKFRPDIIHAVMESYAGAALVFAGFTYPSAKRILTLQSGDLDSDVKQKKFHVRIFWKIIHRSPDFVTAISSALARRAENLGVAKDRIAITPNGLDFSEVPRGLAKESGRVICVGRLSWEKAHELTLKAWVGVLGKFPSAKLVFVGEGPERTKIEKLISELGISESVRLTGNLPHKDVLTEISKSEAFICPSLAEGLGNVFIEAQACGVPPIGTRVGGIPDVIQDGENGILIEPKNSAAIASAIIRLLEDPDLRKRLAERGLETSRKFEWSGIIEKIDGVYENVLSCRA
jgi:glycosyltransferase involved in cell wall biosynthesis